VACEVQKKHNGWPKKFLKTKRPEENKVETHGGVWSLGNREALPRAEKNGDLDEQKRDVLEGGAQGALAPPRPHARRPAWGGVDRVLA